MLFCTYYVVSLSLSSFVYTRRKPTDKKHTSSFSLTSKETIHLVITIFYRTSIFLGEFISYFIGRETDVCCHFFDQSISVLYSGDHGPFILFLVDTMSHPTTLVSQLLDSIDAHLDDVRIPMEHDDDDELWLSGHRSIFSSYGSNEHQTVLPSRPSQQEDFQWDLYADRQYHRLAFERDQQEDFQLNTLSDWSMRLSSDPATSASSDLPRTSWQAIKTKSIPRSFSSCSSTPVTDPSSESEQPLPRTTTLYCLFQRARSDQHPCRLYRNFSEKSLSDSSTSSSSSDVYTTKQTYKVPLPRMTLHSPTTFSQLKLQKSISQQNMLSSAEHSSTTPQRERPVDPCFSTGVDRCLQTSLEKKHPWQPSLSPCQPHRSSPVLLSLPDLNFVTYYARENPTSLSTKTSKCLSRPPKLTSNQPAALPRTVLIRSPVIPKPRSSEGGRTRPFLPSSTEENETSSSTCSSTENSTSSSGYSSSTSHPRPSHSSYPLKSCLKRAKVDDPSSPLTLANVLAGGVAGDVFTLAKRTFAHQHHRRATAQHRRYSMPTVSSALALQRPIREQDRTRSEHDLRSKKSVSFCDDIVRRLITPSTSPTHRSRFYRGKSSPWILVSELLCSSRRLRLGAARESDR